MPTEQGEVTRDSPVCEAIPIVWDKFVVDFANGIDVAHDHLNVQRARSGLFRRLLDGWTGRGHRRQSEINARLLDSMEGSLYWLRDLTESLRDSNLAIVRINKAVCRLSDDVSTLASESANTSEAVADLSAFVLERVNEFAEWAQRKDAYDDAMRQQDLVFAKWARGGYDGISLAGRCYAALEELRWGRFGAYADTYDGQRRRELLRLVRDRAMQQMREDAALVAVYERIPTATWLAKPPIPLTDAAEALAYLAEDHAEAPFVRAVSTNLSRQGMPDDVPLISSAERLADALMAEVLSG